jgi:LAO/AO transport system kinase
MTAGHEEDQNAQDAQDAQDAHSRPEWVPAQGGDAFTTRIVRGKAEEPSTSPPAPADSPTPDSGPSASAGTRRRLLSIEEYVEGVRARDRTVFARAITLIESNAAAHLEVGQEVLRQLLPETGNAIRVGITGVPGVGKSSFIEALGCSLCQQGHHVAVLAVDPSSSITRGSILGDKTRMERLSREPNAFIRPSPSGGTLGGVARKSRETILLCEAAGYDVILVETVGVGQSEITVRSMVDFFLLLMLTGAGDELQGIKKGIMELADAVVINKADGENKIRAQAARQEYERALHYLSPATEGWQTQALTCSALTGEHIADVWGVVEQFHEQTNASGVFTARRRAQARDWVYAMVEEHLRTWFYQHPHVKQTLPQVEQAVVDGTLPPTVAVQTLLRAFEREE